MNIKIIVTTILMTTATCALASEGKGYVEYGETYHLSPGSDFHVEHLPPGSYDAMFPEKKQKNR